ncbi:MAG TPA: arabinan endo-1,5-alpha-L-arabinosidase, partial [Gammaproteobacteria bacterium]|nr:arabinan endo-1,5-alpha-L-arabinosidase [Gammaproteobacteria bacterium]
SSSSSSSSSSGCAGTAITPYLQVNGGAWQQTSSASITAGGSVKFGPQPASGGSWSWSGCGTSGTSREQTVSPTASCAAAAVYTNSCGAQSTQVFNVAVSAGDRCDAGVYNPADPPQIVALSGNLGTHDPTIIQQNGVFYIAQTGPGLQSKQSTNMTNWSGTGSLFSSNPSWISQQVPGATDLWAPDLSFFGGQYHLYYSASTFGSNRSCIGHATRASMASGSWADQGPVICSQTSNDYNTIDPNVIVDQAGTPWLAFGSFWSGIKLIRLNSSGGRADSTINSIASRNGGAIEAPVIIRRCGFYYLFVSFDACCQGANSTYNIRVGRSTNVTGPYADRNGVQMMNGGGTQIVAGNSSWRGPGHSSVFFVGNNAYNMYHAYRASDGAPMLRISEMAWDTGGWPISAGP